MTALPLVHRELALTSRRRSFYRVRFWAAALASAIAMMIIRFSDMPSAQSARVIFAFLSFLAFAYAVFAGACFTADCLSEEKREGTLGFLFLTDLRGYDVVLGKLLVNSLHAIYGLLATLPILALPLMMGGITAGEFWRTALTLVNTMIFSLAIGVLVSALGKSERGVMLWTLFLLAIFTLGLPLIWMIVTHLLVDHRSLDALLLFPSPGYAFRTAAPGALGEPPADYWHCTATVFVMSIIAVSSASLLLPGVFQQKSSVNQAGAGEMGPWRRWRFGSGPANSEARRQRLGQNPISWLLSRDRLPLVGYVLFSAAILIATILAYPIISKGTGLFTQVVAFSTFGLHAFFKLLIALEATRHFNEDKRSGALELLLCTPVPVKAIISAHFGRLRRLFVLPVAAIAVLHIAWLVEANQNLERDVIWRAPILLLCDGYALAWLGLSTAVRGARFARTVLSAWLWVMVPPWVLFIGYMFSGMGRGMSESEARTFMFFWFSVTIVYDFLLALWGRTRVRRQFRTLAADLPPSSFAARPDIKLQASQSARAALG